MIKMIQTRAGPADQGSGMGQNDQFPPANLSDGYLIGQRTFAAPSASAAERRFRPFARTSEIEELGR
jgi:hypothetical protein